MQLFNLDLIPYYGLFQKSVTDKTGTGGFFIFDSLNRPAIWRIVFIDIKHVTPYTFSLNKNMMCMILRRKNRDGPDLPCYQRQWC